MKVRRGSQEVTALMMATQYGAEDAAKFSATPVHRRVAAPILQNSRRCVDARRADTAHSRRHGMLPISMELQKRIGGFHMRFARKLKVLACFTLAAAAAQSAQATSVMYQFTTSYANVGEVPFPPTTPDVQRPGRRGSLQCTERPDW